MWAAGTATVSRNSIIDKKKLQVNKEKLL